ncbi:hypothetical protein FZC66_10430 [Priestia megaterium]|nr:hypothetical protein FZC66_10430 [Priestia megaterium]
MKKRIALLIPLLFLLSACFNDPIQDDLIDYSNNDLSKASELEARAIEAYDSVSGDNYTDDAAMYTAMVNEVIPQYRKFIDELEEIKVETDELRDIHEGYIKAANTQYNAFVKIVSALDKRDRTLIVEANEMLDEARKGIRQYLTDIERLAKEHDVEFKNEENQL